MEEAQCYYALLNNYNLTQEELAKRLGRSQSSIANKLRLLRLSPDVVSAIRENGLSERHARAVLKLKDEEVQLAVIKRTAEKNLSVKDTERLVEKTLDKMYDEKRPGAAPPPCHNTPGEGLPSVYEHRQFGHRRAAGIRHERGGGAGGSSKRRGYTHKGDKRKLKVSNKWLKAAFSTYKRNGFSVPLKLPFSIVYCCSRLSVSIVFYL